MDTLSILLVCAAAFFLLKGLLAAVRAGIDQAKARLARSGGDNQITEPAAQLEASRRRFPTESSIVGFIGFAALVVLAVRLFSLGRAPEKVDAQAAVPVPAVVGQSSKESPQATSEPARVAQVRSTPRPMRAAPGSTALIVTAPGATPEEIVRDQEAAIAATAVTTEQMAQARAKVKQRQVVDMGERVKKGTQELKVLMDAFDDLVGKLVTNDDGKALAAEPRLVRSYRAVLSVPRPERTQAEQVLSQVQMLVEPMELGLDNPGNIAQPDPKLMEELGNLAAQVREAKEMYRSAIAQVLTLVSRAKAEGKLGQVLLKDVIDAQEKEDAAEKIRSIEAETKKARDEGTEREAAAQAELIEAKSKAKAAGIKLESDKILADIETAKKKAKDDEEKAIREQERRRIEALAMDPQIQSQFRPLLDHGFVRYNVHPGGAFQKGDRPRPVSFSDLSNHGWLKDVETFAKAMAGRANTDLYNNFSDRSRYPMPRSDADWKRMEELFEIFKQVGPVWVEMKLLDR